ncbi:hypothetical protein RclHR1_26930003 [Rhizophagus clarus]|uniref:Endonuclease/exonuclease/phosphatase domain-containing protein n=1 Tax=Rhizophagus clarus TaxID=94130 RepID=A0A2Z6R5M9_9GLOM|nr:hypothetical protein RclHR1_26930003 [Rhizophagus clarus]
MMDNNFNYDSFIRNPPNPIDIENFFLQESLFSTNSLTPPPFNFFNISSFNINSLKMYSQNKIELLNNFLSLKQIYFGGVIDTHLHPKQMHFLAKRHSNYTVFSSNLDTFQHVRSSGGISLFIENSLASYVHTYISHSSRLLSVDLYFKGNALSEAKRLGFHHTICGDFNMHLDQFYPTFFNQPQIASKRIYRLFNFLLSNRYVDFTPVNFSDSLGTFHRADIISRIDYVWLCPLLKLFLLISVIFDIHDTCFSDYNPVVTYYDQSLLHSSVKLAYAHQLKWRPHLETLLQHYHFLNRVLHSIKLLCKYPHTFSSSHDQKWSIHLIRLNSIFSLYKSALPVVPALPSTLSSCQTDHFNKLLDTLSQASKLLRGLHLLKEKEFQDSSIKTHIENRDHNFDTDISSFNNSALSRSCRKIVLNRIFINHPTAPRLLTDPKDISDAVVDHFQNAVPIKSTPSSYISALPDRWRSEYLPLNTISPNIYNSLLSLPSLRE